MTFPKKPITTVHVGFGHDMDDSWYDARFPDQKHDGSYGKHTSIEKIANKNGWKIRWHGNDFYNPWKKR